MRRTLTAALTLALALASPRAHAQAPPPLVPPHAIEAGSVPYPPGATTEATVVIELVVDASGNVQNTRIVEGDEPFASATQKAAMSWKFQPAKRGDEFVAARVRMRVAFHPPATPSTSTSGSTANSSSTPATTASPTSTSTPPPEEVRVIGRREEAGEISMASSEVRQIPGAFGDAFRVIDSFPGVTPLATGVPFFFVRGAPPGDTGYFIDGIRMPLLFHVGVGPSVIQPGLVDHVDFYPANAPVEFGRFTGGIVSATTTDPSREPRGEGNLRLFDAGGFVESPFADGKATAMIGGRYSYTGLLLPIFAPDTHLDYWDYQARITYDVDDRDRVSVLALGSHDYLAEDEDDGTGTNTKKTKELLDTDFHRIDLRWDRTTSTHAHLRVATTLGYEDSGDHSGSSRDSMLALRSQYENRVSATTLVRLGADAEIDHYTLIDNDPTSVLPPGKDPTAVYVPRNETTAGVRADVVYRILPRVEVVPGLRADVYTSRRSVYPNVTPNILGTFRSFPTVDHATAIFAVDPRISMRVFATKSLTYFSALGLTHQEPSFIATFPGINPGGLDQGLQSGIQTSQGFEARLPLDLTARITGFYTKYFDLSDATATCIGADFTNTDTATLPCVKNRVDGRAFGAELLVRRPFTKRWSGWLSYTLSRSTREAKPLLGPADHLQEVPSEYDRTHVLSLATAYDLGKRWRAGARFYYYSGRPYTQTYRGYLFPPYDASRLPAFWRIDVRLEKSWRVGKTGQIAFVLEGLNVTLNKETIDAQCPSPRSDSAPLARPAGAPLDQCPLEEIGPVTVPSIGLEGSF